MVPIVLGTLAVVVTHHLTSYALVLVLLALALIYRLCRSPKPNPWPFAVFAGVLAGGWMLIAADDTVDYLDPVFSGARHLDLGHRSSGESKARALFQSASTCRRSSTRPPSSPA